MADESWKDDHESSLAPPFLGDVIREAEERLKAGRPRREATRRKVRQGRFRDLDTPRRLRARVDRVLGDPVARAEVLAAGVVRESDLVEEPSDLLLERIIGGENFLGTNFFDLGKRATRCVAKIDIRAPDGRTGAGTGSMVSQRLLMTNNHVLKTKDWARLSRAVFDFEDDIDGNPLPTNTFSFDPEAFFFTHPGLDFTLVAVQERSLQPQGRKLSEFGFNPMDPEEGKIAKGEFINIIQHPSGLHKQAVIQDNQLLDLPEDWMHYEADTLPGSSGAPLFNNRWELVGLHHAGWPNRDDQDRILARNGEVWTRDMGEQAIHWLGNEGARVSRMIKAVREASSTFPAQGQELLEQLLNPPKRGSVVVPQAAESRPVSRPRTPPVEKPILQSSLPEGTATPRNAPRAEAVSGQVMLTVPLHITISLGATTIPSSGVQPQVHAAMPAPVSAGLAGDRAAALRELEEAQTRPYYDAEEDASQRTAYYEGIDFADLGTDALYDALSALVAGTHSQKLGYKPSRQLYPWVDLQPDLKLRSLYTGDVFEPEQVIEEALELEAEFEVRKEALLAEASLDDQALEALFLLEAGPPFNCEHVVPQSWFKGEGSNVPKGDLHHLFTCQTECNSFRGSVPFWDFPDFEEALLQGCGRKEGNRFEPTRGKGPAARGTLYFLLRYPGKIDDNAGELQAERLSILLSWHAGEPVTEWERHRNAAIYGKQGNRNPLIDFPELAGRINFVRGLRRNA